MTQSQKNSVIKAFNCTLLSLYLGVRFEIISYGLDIVLEFHIQISFLKAEVCYIHVQCSPFIRLCLNSIGMDNVIGELCYKWRILQRKQNFYKF